MMSEKKVQNTHTPEHIRDLHRSVMDLVGAVDRFRRDEVLLREANVPLDRALFPLLLNIEQRGPIAVGDLADCVGRDYTTVSRQVAKLESLGLVTRRESATDRRMREATITAEGKAMTDHVDATRYRVSSAIFESWDAHDFGELVRLMRKFADALNGELPIGERTTSKRKTIDECG